MRLDKPYTNKQYAELAVYCNANNCHIEDKGDYLEAVENVAPILTKEEIEQKRADLYRSQVDPIMSEYNRKKLFNLFEEGEEDVLLKAIEGKVAEIKENNPYPVEESEVIVPTDETEQVTNQVTEAVKESEVIEDGLQREETEIRR